MALWKPFEGVAPDINVAASNRVLITPKKEGQRIRGLTIRIGYDVVARLGWNMTTGLFIPVEDGDRIGIAPTDGKGWKPSSHGLQKKARTYVLCIALPTSIQERFCPGCVRTEWAFEIEDSVLVLTKPFRKK